MSQLGPQLGVQEEGYPGRDQALRCRYHKPAGGGDGAVLQLFPARAEAGRLQRHILAQVKGEAHGRERAEVRGRLRDFLQDVQVS